MLEDMGQLDRLARYATTRKQQEFEWDFTQGVDRYEAWDEITIGQQGSGARSFTVCEEDILAFNLSARETDPLLTDPDYAAQHGGLVQHPLFVVQVAFYCIDTGIGSWIRSPGARNPGQSIELIEPFLPCEQISATITHWDKWIRRDNHYMEDKVELRNQDGQLKATWFVRLLLPPSRAELERFAALLYGREG